MPAPAAGSSMFRFFFERRPVEKAMGGAGTALKGVSNESGKTSPPGPCGRPTPSGRDREKCCDGADGATCGMPKTEDRGGAIGVSPRPLDEADDGVCAIERGWGVELPKLPRGAWGRPMRLASNVPVRNGV